MKKKKKVITGMITALCLFVLIVDTKTAISGAQKGIELCLLSIIPSLFPFCVLSKIISSILIGCKIKWMQPIRILTRMPKGTESILLLSFVSGYPLGAQAIDSAYEDGYITLDEAKRLLAFCNNAGPAFIFGILCSVIYDKWSLWFLYGIHIFSAIVVGILVPGGSTRNIRIHTQKALSLPKALESGIKTISLVCAWIVVFKIIEEYLRHWFTHQISALGQSLVAGFLEMSNGCILLQNLECMGLRYILCAVFLSFGGMCITLQTISVVKNVPLSKYIWGKIMHSGISGIFAALTQYCFFSGSDTYPSVPITLVCLSAVLLSMIVLYSSKKGVAIPQNIVYNIKNKQRGTLPYAISKKASSPLPVLSTWHKGK